jgi:hypothetical protein
MFDHGWFQECHHCGQMIREDECDNAGNYVEFDIVERGTLVFCRPACSDGYYRDEVERAQITANTIDDLTAGLLRALPGAVPAGRPHVYVPRFERDAHQGIVSFEFPGARIGFAQWRFDKPGEDPRLAVCAGDMRAFRAWRAAGYPPHLMDANIDCVP